VEILLVDTSTKRSSNPAPFDKISKSGDSGGSGDIFSIKEGQLDNNNNLFIKIETLLGKLNLLQ
jgi:hypothetical protein